MNDPDTKDFMSDNRQSLFVNAAIMDEFGEPTNPPWVVSLKLPTDQKLK
jgi:hypothetical protein